MMILGHLTATYFGLSFHALQVRAQVVFLNYFILGCFLGTCNIPFRSEGTKSA
jgi:hypothetical protein